MIEDCPDEHPQECAIDAARACPREGEGRRDDHRLIAEPGGDKLPRQLVGGAEPVNPNLNVSRNANLPHSPGIRIGDYIFLSGMGPVDPAKRPMDFVGARRAFDIGDVAAGVETLRIGRPGMTPRLPASERKTFAPNAPWL